VRLRNDQNQDAAEKGNAGPIIYAREKDGAGTLFEKRIHMSAKENAAVKTKDLATNRELGRNDGGVR